jgi:hypothetical protein
MEAAMARADDAERRSQSENAREKDLSTEQNRAQTAARISRPHGHRRRPQGHRCAPRARPQAPVGLSPNGLLDQNGREA